MSRGSGFNLISIRLGGGKRKKAAEVRSSLEFPRLAADCGRCGRRPCPPQPAGHFHPPAISALEGGGEGGGRGPWVRAKTVTSDRDGGRLREEVFMCVCGRRRQGSLAGGWGVVVVGVGGLIPNGRARTGVRRVCVCARRGRGRSFAAAHKMVIVA